MNERVESKNSVKVEIKNRLLSSGARIYFQLQNLPQETKDLIVGQIVGAALRGERRSLAKDAEEILKHYDDFSRNIEAIPRAGPVLFVANHWNKGPQQGNWTYLMISREAAKVRDVGSEVRWIANGDAFGPVSGWRLPFTTDVVRRINQDVYGMHVVNLEGEINGVFKIRESFKRGDMIGLFPEAYWSDKPQPGVAKAGALTSFLARARPDGKIIPVGLYSRETKGSSMLFANFGDPFSCSEIIERFTPFSESKETREKVFLRISDFLMRKITRLVPHEYRLSDVL